MSEIAVHFDNLLITLCVFTVKRGKLNTFLAPKRGGLLERDGAYLRGGRRGAQERIYSKIPPKKAKSLF